MPNKRGSDRSGAPPTAPNDRIVDSSLGASGDADHIDRAAGQMRVPGGMAGTIVQPSAPAESGSEPETGAGNETVSGAQRDLGIGQDRVKGGQG